MPNLLTSKILGCCLLSALAATIGPAFAQDTASALKLYTDKQYPQAVEAFERLLNSGKTDARTYYYAALANLAARRNLRAKQLFDYVIAAFPSSQEAGLAKSAMIYFGKSTATKDATVAASNAATKVSTAIAGAATAGAAVQSVASAAGNRISPAGSNVIMRKPKDSSEGAKTAKLNLFARPHHKGDFVFTPDEIAREGANGIDQTNAPNCWFEAAMSALAQLPRGQKMLARMITYGEGESYMVRFPGDGREYKITEERLEDSGVDCKAKWASLLDYAERLKFPHNIGASGPDGDMHRLQVGLSCITGCRADMLIPNQASTQEISSFIYGAISSNNPITCGTSGRNSRVWAPIIENHAYTIIGFDSARNMVIIRNPHGRESETFAMPDDPQHLKFEQLTDGVFKMNLELFKDAFGSVCRSFI